MQLLEGIPDRGHLGGRPLAAEQSPQFHADAVVEHSEAQDERADARNRGDAAEDRRPSHRGSLHCIVALSQSAFRARAVFQNDAQIAVALPLTRLV